MSESLSTKAGLVGVGRLLLAIAVAYLFLVVLMTASAQQRVNTLLQASAPASKNDYSSALVLVKGAEALQDRLKHLQVDKESLRAEVQAKTGGVADAKAASEDAWGQFEPIAASVAKTAGCNLSGLTDEVARWNGVLECQASGAIQGRLAALVSNATQQTGNFGEANRQWQAEARALAGLRNKLDSITQDIDGKTKLLDETAELQRDFGELSVIRGSWMLGGGVLADFPPSMMQIILAFFSGIFGALLITLVLMVYPQDKMGFTTSSDFEARLFLGGLISVCVYIVLGGGSAILGNSTPFNAGQANFMTFCAVGVLAGMFSDRVAFWLSDRANSFFGRKPDPNANGAANPPPPTGPIAPIV